jgi:aspartate dehydrogenase
MTTPASSLCIGMIGLGAIGRGVARLAAAHRSELQLVGVLTRTAPVNPPDGIGQSVRTLDELLSCRPEIVVEAAGHTAFRQYVPETLRRGLDVLCVSVGALADPDVEAEVRAAAAQGGARLRVASGALGALDAIAAASLGGLTCVTHTTRKPARSLLGDEAEELTAPRELYRGPAREAARLFPESVNVSAAVSLAGVGFDRTEVRVVADPDIDRNTHQVEVEGAFGSLRFEIRNVPTDENPRTGRLTAMSVVSCLLQSRTPLAIG